MKNSKIETRKIVEKAYTPRILSLWGKNPETNELEYVGHNIIIGDAMNNVGGESFLTTEGDFGDYYERKTFKTKEEAQTIVDNFLK